jgi:hypothetical protein
VVAYRRDGSVGIGAARRTAQLIADELKIKRFWQVGIGSQSIVLLLHERGSIYVC